MKFYIVKKDQQLEAIPAEEELLESYQNNNYKYVNIVSACNKQDALKRLPSIQKSNKKRIIIGVNIAAISIILAIYTIN
ncbi:MULTISPECIES: hypothetical protein [Pseudoalteromonas]|uniref:Uncharacterized protein n=1 Tax=Pseudoalteromonas fuliginea TaxID=1872678 RepID=A0ABD3YCH2_9GAMM|nr:MULTISPECIES: hypothetical protein [Pseudoalteromonas]KDC52634.1 hypothetical protein DC53_03905 [Pseudoalteromonas fuliginea]KJZ22352.1 hypothetical protein TW82_19710 [Pseudoalteromonas fuliginea]GAA81696.1 hypothetical protein P20495_4236 [Pseudoalteromonas sp. BSi20495]